ncbi:hypothetical protein [Flavobacterium sp. JP2137]|uniref:hypothetical protein n=1 Tax=Flavobacterium sp. JP2137 TaxID=3414510 RepID=UPI003D2F9E99
MISVLMIVLALFPCSDRNAATVTDHTIAQWTASPHQEAAVDMCNPFCVCNCCTSPILVKSAFFFELPSIASISLKNSDYYQSFIITVLHFIWKPPRTVYFN